MGDYFNEEEMEEKEEEDVDEDIDEDFNDIKEIVAARNDLRSVMYPIVEDLKERLGRINYSLFGDPRNPDAEGKLDLVEEELEYPNLRQHPIAKKIMAVIDEIRDLQREYKKLHKIYENNTKRMGALLDKSLTLTIAGRKAEEEATEPEHKVTNEMVAKFKELYGDVILAKYKEGWEIESYDMAYRAKNLFIEKAAVYFENVSEYPKEFATALLDKLAVEPWEVVRTLYKKKGTSSENSIPVEEKLPQQSAIKEITPKGFKQLSEVTSNDKDIQAKTENIDKNESSKDVSND